MKYTKTAFTALVTIFISTIVHGQNQNQGIPDELNLKGKWKASCPVELVNQQSVGYCKLCSFVIDPKDSTMANVEGLEMNFMEDSIALTQSGKMITVPLKRSNENRSFSFDLASETYSFRIFNDEKQQILEDKDGMLLVLERANQ